MWYPLPLYLSSKVHKPVGIQCETSRGLPVNSTIISHLRGIPWEINNDYLMILNSQGINREFTDDYLMIPHSQ